jgi:hypothetical protein
MVCWTMGPIPVVVSDAILTRPPCHVGSFNWQWCCEAVVLWASNKDRRTRCDSRDGELATYHIGQIPVTCTSKFIVFQASTVRQRWGTDHNLLIRSDPRIARRWSAPIRGFSLSDQLRNKHILCCEKSEIISFANKIQKATEQVTFFNIARVHLANSYNCSVLLAFLEWSEEKRANVYHFMMLDWSKNTFLAERITERSRASCSCGLQKAAPLCHGAEQPWEFSAPIRS